MLISDPLRLDFLDHYTNILHTLGSRGRLALVTQIASSVNRYRPETCCAIGNYYSLSSRHEDAVYQFRLALQLDRNFSSAWTLLGHEYFKLGNSHAAVEAYMRAVEGNNKDYRAFVGLGVVYEGLEKPTFSLHYYRRAVALRPDDGELWQMTATCLMGMERVPQAIEALKKAITYSGHQTGNRPGDALDARCKRIELYFQLANAYEEVQERAKAIKYMEICLDESDDEGRGDVEGHLRTAIVFILNRSRLLLARWAAEDGDDTRARYLVSQVDQKSEFAEDAQVLLRTLVATEEGSRGE